MNSISHILNGDALKQGFPKRIPGELIIVRECLIEGDVSRRDLDGFFASRISWLGEAYNESRENYKRRVKQEFKKILNLDKKSEINLWFEEDLFCQVNLWFVCYLLKLIDAENVYLIKPESQDRYGFGG
ncbi:DUF1835 domain-containing protein [Gramella sp. BOM4]|nr:DUF1835 domain-containing protein [Christiangramia bathymodioli]